MHIATRQTIIIFLSVAVASFAACARQSAEAGRDTAAAATVNGKNVMLNEVDKIINQQFQGQQSQMSPLELAQARLQVLDTLIQKEVLFQRAEKEKLLPSDDEITQFINTQMQQSQMTQEEFQKRLRETNQTPESLREESRKALANQKLQDRINGNIVAPNEK